MSTTYYICSIFSGSKKNITILLYITRVRVLYERVLKTKIDFEITTFLNYELELQEQKIQNQITTRKNPKTKVLPLTREQMGVIKQ